ncbi:MAG: membrane fusion protein (multidrug efflux system) [Bacteroidia bacterium]|jgi:membrane fusion protein (multidrug efflux system)
MSLYKSLFAVLIISLLAACETTSDKLASKRTELEGKLKEMSTLKADISKLKTEIEALDTAPRENTIPVFASRLVKGEFKNPFQMQGLVESDQNVMITPEVPSRITRIYVREGQKVSRGQLIATLDGSIAESQISEMNNALALAKINYEKQKSLWDQKIGSEMQFLQAKNSYENLQKSVETAQKQLAKYTLRSPITGTVDEIMANEGELVGSMTSGPIARIVNLSDVKIRAKVSENYVGSIKVGQSVQVYFPSLNVTLTEKIEAIGNVIDVNNRTFAVYVKPHGNQTNYKPNMLAMITAYDYIEGDALTVPTKLIRSENEKDYVFVVKSNGSRLTVEKRAVVIEKEFAAITIIKSGLSANDIIITEGYNGLVEGDQVSIVNVDFK